MFTPAAALQIDDHQRKRLQHLVRSGQTPQKIALRARIILAAGEGRPNHAIARQLGVSRPTVLLWRDRFAASGIPGILKDAPRPGRRKAITPEVIKRVIAAQKKMKAMIVAGTPGSKERDAILKAQQAQYPTVPAEMVAASFDATRTLYDSETEITRAGLQDTIDFYNAGAPAGTKVSLKPEDVAAPGLLK